MIFRLLEKFNNVLYKNKKRIVLYSNIGFRDNVRAVFDYLIAHKFNDTYEIVCVSDDFFGLNSKKIKNVKFKNVYNGFFYFLSSKYFFYCFGKYPIHPAKKQIVINLWHGMPIKKIGNMEYDKKLIDYNYFTYLICYSHFFLDIMKSSFNARSSQIIYCGSPRNDELFNAKNKMVNTKYSKTIAWLPTYRENYSVVSKVITNSDKAYKLNNTLKRMNINLVIKPHPLDNINIENERLSNIQIINDKFLLNKNLTLYKFLATTDALITDYSSVSFDYLLLNNPIGYIMSDLEVYKKGRGLNFDDIDDIIAGEKIFSYDDLLLFCENIGKSEDIYSNDRKKLNDLVNKIQTPTNIKTILEFVGINRGKLK